jgi:hypothetical protein
MKEHITKKQVPAIYVDRLTNVNISPFVSKIDLSVDSVDGTQEAIFQLVMPTPALLDAINGFIKINGNEAVKNKIIESLVNFKEKIETEWKPS